MELGLLAVEHHLEIATVLIVRKTNVCRTVEVGNDMHDALDGCQHDRVAQTLAIAQLFGEILHCGNAVATIAILVAHFFRRFATCVGNRSVPTTQKVFVWLCLCHNIHPYGILGKWCAIRVAFDVAFCLRSQVALGNFSCGVVAQTSPAESVKRKECHKGE